MLKNMKIKKRLTTAFVMIASVVSLAAVLGCCLMLYMSSQYQYALKNFGFSQGDLGKTMVTLAETRSAARAIISYTEEEVIKDALEAFKSSEEAFNNYMDSVVPTMTTDKEKQIYSEVKPQLEEYWKLIDEIIELGNTLDAERSAQAQIRAANELDPLYDSIYNGISSLMDTNINNGNEMEARLEVLRTVFTIVIITCIVCALIISIVLGEKISNGIAKPLNALSSRLKTFSEGNLAEPFPKTENKDEVADMIGIAAFMAGNLKAVIDDLEFMLDKMANGDYSQLIKNKEIYAGEFIALREAAEQMNSRMNKTLEQINDASKQVAAGSINLAEGAQSLAEGATDQAGAIEELQATITNITENIGRTAENIDESYNHAQRYADEAEVSRKEMQSMVGAMERISETSQKIGNIISDIEDIATQTNLLSLNAAIEAARAGEAGKGFAVVADQIRNLAEQSAKSAVDTRNLIESSIAEVADGNRAAEMSANSIAAVVEGIKEIADTSRQLREVSIQEAEAMKQAEIGVAQISEVVQSNSATAEESSATSEELSAQADTLSTLVSQFKLCNS